jgi:hypothetical protein
MPEQPAAEVDVPAYKRVRTADLIPYARNARTHSDDQVAQIAASIREFGFTNPVLTDGANGIVAGHGRVLAARKLGLADVPVIELAHLTPAQRRAYVLADNKLALNAGWDADLLRLELAELQDLGFDLDLTGFDADEIAGFLAEPTTGLTDPDDIPPLPEVPVTRPGDVWLLGRHRLACGDCTDAAVVAAVLGGVRPHLMVTDPPYGVAYDPEWRNRAGVSTTRRTGRVENDDRADWREAWALFPGDVAYVWHGALHATTVADSLIACGFAIRAQIIWAKDRLVLGRGHYHWQHEPAWYAVRGQGHWSGDRKQTTLWQIAGRSEDAETVHGEDHVRVRGAAYRHRDLPRHRPQDAAQALPGGAGPRDDGGECQGGAVAVHHGHTGKERRRCHFLDEGPRRLARPAGARPPVRGGAAAPGDHGRAAAG